MNCRDWVAKNPRLTGLVALAVLSVAPLLKRAGDQIFSSVHRARRLEEAAALETMIRHSDQAPEIEALRAALKSGTDEHFSSNPALRGFYRIGSEGVLVGPDPHQSFKLAHDIRFASLIDPIASHAIRHSEILSDENTTPFRPTVDQVDRLLKRRWIPNSPIRSFKVTGVSMLTHLQLDEKAHILKLVALTHPESGLKASLEVIARDYREIVTLERSSGSPILLIFLEHGPLWDSILRLSPSEIEHLVPVFSALRTRFKDKKKPLRTKAFLHAFCDELLTSSKFSGEKIQLVQALREGNCFAQ